VVQHGNGTMSQLTFVAMADTMPVLIDVILTPSIIYNKINDSQTYDETY